MFRFLFKSALLGTGALIALGLAYGPDQLRSWVREGKQAVKEQISEYQGMSKELRTIQRRVDELDGEIRKLKESAVRSEIEVRNLEEEVEQRESSLNHLEGNLEKANVLLGGDATCYMIGGVSYTRGEVEGDVQDKIELFKVQQSTHQHLRETLMAHRNALALAKENVARGEVVRTELRSKVRLLEAQLKRFEAKKVYHEAVAKDFITNEFNTGLGEARKLLADFENKLAVKNRMLDEQMKVETTSKVTGIDYSEPERPADVRAQLSMILHGEGNSAILVVEKSR